MRDTCSTFDSTAIKKLELKFLDYKIFSLSVDENKNVFIRLTESDQPPSLIRFSETKFISEKDKDWKKIKDNWYEHEE